MLRRNRYGALNEFLYCAGNQCPDMHICHSNDAVQGYLTPEQIVEFLVKVKEYKNSTSINFDDFIPSWYVYTDSDGKPHGVTFLDTIDELGFFVRVAHRIEDGKNVRFCKKCNATLDVQKKAVKNSKKA